MPAEQFRESRFLLCPNEALEQLAIGQVLERRVADETVDVSDNGIGLDGGHNSASPLSHRLLNIVQVRAKMSSYFICNGSRIGCNL
jgi:hypothetical protein